MRSSEVSGVINKTFETVCEFGSGAIIGSAFIKHLKEKGTSKESIQGFVEGIRK